MRMRKMEYVFERVVPRVVFLSFESNLDALVSYGGYSRLGQYEQDVYFKLV